MLGSNFAQSGPALTPMNSPALSSNANCTRAHDLARDTLAYLHILIGKLPRRSGRGPDAREMWLRSLSALSLCRAGPMAKRSRREMAPQRLEKIESAPGNGMVSEASNLQHLVRGARRLRLTSDKNDKVESCRKRRLTLWNRSMQN
jgi:hypothetical protein